MTEIKRELPIEDVEGLDATTGRELTTDDLEKRVVLRIRAKPGEDPDDVKRERSVAFNAYNLALHSGVYCSMLNLDYPIDPESTLPCIENIDFSAMPNDPYSDSRSILPVPERKGEQDPISVDSLRFLASFVNRTGPVEPVGRRFKYFPPPQYMEAIYQAYDTIPELNRHLEAANRMGFHSLSHFIASEVAAQLRMVVGDAKPTPELLRAFNAGEYAPNHDTPRRSWMLTDQSSDRAVAEAKAEIEQAEAKRA